MNRKEIVWKGYLDRSKFGKYLNGKKICDNCVDRKKNGYFFISSCLCYDEMKSDLMEQGILDEQIYGFNDNQLWYKIYADIVDWKTYTKKSRSSMIVIKMIRDVL